jgi:hypothetical protein
MRINIRDELEYHALKKIPVAGEMKELIWVIFFLLLLALQIFFPPLLPPV